MFRMLAVLLMSLLFFGSGISVLKSDIVDQQQLDASSTVSAADGVFYNIQSFQQTNNNITGASVAVRNVPTGTPITIRLYDDLAQASNPSLALALGSVVTATTSQTPQFESVSFVGGPISVVPGQTMYLTFEKATGAGNTVQGQQGLGGFQGILSSTYPNGHVFSGGTEFTNFDFAFQTFAVDPNAVPEPSSMLIVGLGLAGLLRRRRIS